MRRGVLACHGWKLGKQALRALQKGAKANLSAADLVPNFEQKGVASLAIKRLVTGVVLLTGDSDMIPAMKLARREGLRVFLGTLGHPVRPELKIHADLLL